MEPMNADDGDYGAQLAAEVVALRDSVEGWQSAGRPLGRPIDIDSDRRLADAVTHLTAAAAALDALTTIDNPAAGGTYLSVDTSGRSRVPMSESRNERGRRGSWEWACRRA